MAQITLNSTGVASDGSLVLQSNGTTAAVTIDTSQRAAFVAGTAAAPAITTTGDTNTGIFFPAADQVAITTGGTQRVVVDASGNVGIGTSSPTSALDVSGKITAVKGSSGGITIGDVSTNSNSVLRMQGTSAGKNWQIANNLNVAGLEFTPSTTNGGTTFTTPAVAIDSSGNLLVGKTSSSLNVGAELQANGTISSTRSTSTSGTTTMEVYSTGAGAYRFYVNMAGTVFATSTTISGISDVRLKENIRDLDDGLEKVMSLQPRKFDWKEGKGAGTKDARGFIAQEFEAVFPDMIEQWLDPAPEGEEPYKAVNANLIPTLVKAIQEQQALITQLQADVAALKGASA